MIALFEQLGAGEVLLILGLALLLFGAKRLPEIGRGLGKGIREFRGATKGLSDELRAGIEGDDETEAPSPATPRKATRRKDAAD